MPRTMLPSIGRIVYAGERCPECGGDFRYPGEGDVRIDVQGPVLECIKCRLQWEAPTESRAIRAARFILEETMRERGYVHIARDLNAYRDAIAAAVDEEGRVLEQLLEDLHTWMTRAHHHDKCRNRNGERCDCTKHDLTNRVHALRTARSGKR